MRLVSRLLFVCCCVAVALVVALSGSRETGGARTSVVAVTPQPAEHALRDNKATERAARRVSSALKGRSSRAVRDRSRLRFAGLSSAEALYAVRRHHRELVVDKAGRAPKLRRKERIVSYISPSAAVFARGTGKNAELAIVESVGEPMATQAPGGRTGEFVALDLTLSERGGSWRPRRAAVDVALPKESGEAASIAGDQLRVRVLGASVSGRLVAQESKAFYAETLLDTDAVLAPVNGGLQVAWALRSERAPESLGLEVFADDVKAVQPVSRPDGSVELLDGTSVLGRVSQPTAWDADGAPVPVSMRVDDGRLFIDVEHAGRGFRYPIAVDPVVSTGGAPAWVESPGASEAFVPTRHGWAFHTFQPSAFIASPASDPYLQIVAVTGQGPGSAWWAFDPIRNSSVFRVEYYGVSRGAGGSCLGAGVYSPASGFADSGLAQYWTAPDVPGEDPPAGGVHAHFGNCGPGGMARTHIHVCAGSGSTLCWLGSPDNLAVFQLGASSAPSDAAMEAAYVYHREISAPAVTVATETETAWTREPLQFAMHAHDQGGIGFCSDTNFFAVPDTLPYSFAVTSNRVAGVVGSAAVGGCNGYSWSMPAPEQASFGWTEGVGRPLLADGPHQLSFTASDMLSNKTTVTRTVRIDRTGPAIAVGGRLAGFGAHRDGATGSFPAVGVRALTGRADVVIDVRDRSETSLVATSGLSSASARIWRLTSSGAREAVEVTLFDGAASCAGQDDCARPAERFVIGDPGDSGTAVNLGPGVYQLEVDATDRVGNARNATYVFAKGGGELTSVVDGQASAQWVPLQAERLTGSPQSAVFQWRTGDRAWADVPVGALFTESDASPVSTPHVAMSSGRTGRYVLDLEELLRLASPALDDFVNDQVFVRARFDGAGSDWERVSEDVSIRRDRGGRNTADETIELGPGNVDLLTGNMALSATDAAAGGNESGVSLERTYGSRYSSASGALGPGWSVGLPADGATEFVRAIDLDDPARDLYWQAFFGEISLPINDEDLPEERYPAVEIQTADGSGFVFERRASDSTYVPEQGFHDFSLKRLSSDDGLRTVGFVLTDHQSGTSTSFEQRLDNPAVLWREELPEHGTWAVTSVDSASTPSSPQWRYQRADQLGLAGAKVEPGQMLPTRALAGTDGSFECSLAAPQRGCQGIELEYTVVAGEVRLHKLARRGTENTVSVAKPVVQYGYTADGRLASVTDLRSCTSPGVGCLVEQFTYEPGTALLASVTPPGERPHELSYYAHAEEKFRGRLSSVARREAPAALPATWSLVYSDRTFDGADPWDLSTSEISKWGQAVTPFRAAALFPPDVVKATDKETLRKASISYLDAMGREINHADPGGRISARDFDKWGNVVREITPAGRAAALTEANTQEAADRRASHTFYETTARGSTRPIRTVGPERDVKTSSGIVRGRDFTLTQYDTGISPGDPQMPYNLPTLRWESALVSANPDGSGGSLDMQAMRATQTEYQLSTRQPTKIVEDLFGTATIRSYVRDATGKELERRQPSAPNTASAPTTTHTTYYTKTGSAPCGGRPEWVGLICEMTPGSQPGQPGLGALSSKRFAYDFWQRPVQVTEWTTDKDGYGRTRIVNTQFDARDRPSIESYSGGGVAVERVRHVYDDATGREVRTEQIDSAGNVNRAVEREYDALGRQVSYTDAGGFKQETIYDLLSRPVQELNYKNNGWVGGRSMQYDPVTGYVTGVVDTAIGVTHPTTATYDLDGRPVTVTYPFGVTKALEYDETGAPSRIAYTKTTGCSSACTWYSNEVTRSEHGQIIDDVSTLGTRRYKYDGLGRIKSASDSRLGEKCATRSYAYDADSNRLTKRAAQAASVLDPCPVSGSGGSLDTSAYDSAGRHLAVDSAAMANTGELEFDAWGRVTYLPDEAAGGAGVESTYFQNDLAHSISVGPVSVTNTLDPMGRTRTRTTTGGLSPGTQTYGYGDDSDSPLMVFPDSGPGTRFATDPAGDLAVEFTPGQTRLLQIRNVRGDVVATAAAEASGTGLTDTFPVDEFGVPEQASEPGRYGFIGAKQRESLHAGAVVAMGVRTYSPHTGRFLQVDPVLGGSANPYDYANQDACNLYDLDGRYATWQSAMRAIFQPVKRLQRGLGTAAKRCAKEVWKGAVMGGVVDVAYAAANRQVSSHSRRFLKLAFTDRGAKGRKARRQLGRSVSRAVIKSAGAELAMGLKSKTAIGVAVSCVAGIVGI